MINLISEIKRKKSAVVVGLDPRVDQLPEEIRAKHNLSGEYSTQDAAAGILEFNKGIIDAVCDFVPAVKPQIAFYEVYGSAGYAAYEETVKYAQEKGLYVVGDIKRGDIGSTCDAYAKAHFEQIPTDSVTVNAYLGEDGVKPFLKYTEKSGKGMFILVKTSNPSSGQLQDRHIDSEPVYMQMAKLVNEWGKDFVDASGYTPVGAVVGATYPEELEAIRKVIPNAYFLIPGYGAQGGGGKNVVGGFNADGLGALVNSSRGIIFAYQKRGGNYMEAAAAAVHEMNSDINTALEEAGKKYW